LTELRDLLAERYQVERQIGEGGMAAVFLADDVKHRRKVAIKVLRPELAAAIGVERFLKEIEITASLQHPHILPLHDSGVVGSSVYYVMPFVDGETLRDRLSREGQFPIDDAVEIASDVCSALDYAHRKGVIHRDIKPENILLHEGGALVVDFGIALAATTLGGERLTRTGMSVGTPQYMSPEQASGERIVDARADLYALGCVLYEMLIGEPPFVAPTAQAIIARVLGDAPRAPAFLRPTIPANVNDAVLTALQKIPADRFTSALQFGAALHDRGYSARTADGATERRTGLARRVGRAAPWIITVGAVATATWTLRSRLPVDSRQAVRFSLTLPPPMRFDLAQLDPTQSSLAVTSDGSHILFLLPHDGRRQIYVRAIGSDDVRPIAGTEGARYIFTSPDGATVAFETTEGDLYRVPIAGGSVTTIARSAAARHGSWGTKDLIAYSGGIGGPLMVVPAAGGEPKAFTALDSAHGEVAQGQPSFLPSGDAVVFTSFRRNGDRKLGVATLEGHVKQLDVSGTSPAFVPPNHLLFARPDGVLRAVGFDPKTFVVSGSPVPVAEGIAGSGAPWNVQVAVASSGNVLAFARGQRMARLALLGAEGAIQFLPGEARNYRRVSVSPDGSRLAVSIVTDGLEDVWTYDITSGVASRLTVDGHSGGPTWSPDGKRIAFTRTSLQTGVHVFQTPSDGSGEQTLLVGGPGNQFAAGWLPDGKAFIYSEIIASSGLSRVSEVDSAGTRRVLAESAVSGLTSPAVSPDGRWLAYVSNESRRLEVSVRSTHAGGRWQVSLRGGTDPVWSRDSKALFYRDGVHIVAAAIGANPGFVITSRRNFADDQFAANYDVMPDGKHLIVLVPDEQDAGITIVANWRSELERRLAAQVR
jgi:tRNA A-37 threonylcarbamoyl transferase component Bud32/WD40 repeat protein